MTAVVEKSVRDRRARRLRVGLGALQVLIGLGAVCGGIGLVSDPSGANLRFQVEWLAGSPFPDYLIPGIVLLAVNGLGSLIGSAVSFAGKRFAGETATALGLFMVAWIVVQVYWIGLSSWLQPLFFGLGLLEVALGFWVRRDLRNS